MIEQAGLHYQVPAAKLDDIEKPGTTLGLRLFKNTTDGNWYVKNSVGTITRFAPSAGMLVISAEDFDASGNEFPEEGGSGQDGAIVRGDTFVIGVAGLLSGTYVRPGFMITALDDAPAQTASKWSIVENADAKVTTMLLNVGDEDTPITAGENKFVFRAPYQLDILGVRASLKTAQVGGDLITLDVKLGGVTVFTTKPTFDNGEKTTVTAATPSVLNVLATRATDDQEIAVDIDQIGADSVASGLKVTLYVARS